MTISVHTAAISRAGTNSNPEAIPEAIAESIPEATTNHSHSFTLLQAGALWQWLCEAVGDHLSIRYMAEVDFSLSSHICSKIVLGRNVFNCSSAVDSILHSRDH
jgi:hypothetical protein